MIRPTNEEEAMFLRIAGREPAFIAFCEKQRSACLDALEQGASDLTRGQSVTYRELLSYLQPPTR